MTTGSDQDFVHPADALGLALDRASSLLSVLGDLYNSSHGSFASGNSFVVHGLTTASDLLADARSALLDLHDGCDLVMRDGSSDSRSETLSDEPVVAFTRSAAEPAWGVAEAAAEPYAAPASVAAGPSQQEHFAKSYLELLKKLTAAEVFASEQQALAAPGTGTDLLPLLRGLREDFQKMHNVG